MRDIWNHFAHCVRVCRVCIVQILLAITFLYTRFQALQFRISNGIFMNVMPKLSHFYIYFVHFIDSLALRH